MLVEVLSKVRSVVNFSVEEKIMNTQAKNKNRLPSSELFSVLFS